MDVKSKILIIKYIHFKKRVGSLPTLFSCPKNPAKSSLDAGFLNYTLDEYLRRWFKSKQFTWEEVRTLNKVLVAIILFALTAAIIVAVIIPIMKSGKTAGQGAKDKLDDTQTDINTLSAPVSYNVFGYEITQTV